MACIHVRGKECTVFLTSGEETKLQHFLSRTLFGTHHVRGKEAYSLPYIRVRELSYSIIFSFSYFVSFYSSCIMLGVNSVQFSFHQGRKVKLQHFNIEISSKNARVQSRGFSLNVVCILF